MIFDEDKHKTDIPKLSEEHFMKFWIYSQGKVIAKRVDAEKFIEIGLGIGAHWEGPCYIAMPAGVDIVAQIRKAKDKLKEAGYLWEAVVEKPAHEAHNKARSADEVKKFNAYMNDLWDEYVFSRSGHKLNMRQLEVVYGRAYAEAHSAGMEEVEAHLEDLIDFACDIINAGKGV